MTSFIEIQMGQEFLKKNKDYQKLKCIDLLDKICWTRLQIHENDTLQIMLLNLFFIIEGNNIDTFLKKWEEIYKESDNKQSQIRKLKKDLLTNPTEWNDETLLKYQEKLELDKIYRLEIRGEQSKYKSANVRNCLAHGAYWLDAKNGNIAFQGRKRRTKTLIKTSLNIFFVKINYTKFR